MLFSRAWRWYPWHHCQDCQGQKKSWMRRRRKRYRTGVLEEFRGEVGSSSFISNASWICMISQHSPCVGGPNWEIWLEMTDNMNWIELIWLNDTFAKAAKPWSEAPAAIWARTLRFEASAIAKKKKVTAAVESSTLAVEGCALHEWSFVSHFWLEEPRIRVWSDIYTYWILLKLNGMLHLQFSLAAPVAIWPIVVAPCRHCPIVGHMLRWQ